MESFIGNRISGKAAIVFVYACLIAACSVPAENTYEITPENKESGGMEAPSESEFNFTRILFSNTDSGRLPLFTNNTIVMRRRFDKERYGFYSGKNDGNSFAVKSEFPIEDKMPVEWFMKKKFYLSPDDHYSNDVATVYFSRTSVYVENAQRLWYVDRGWEMLEVAGRSKPVVVTTDPEGAAVISDGIVLGSTPYTLDMGRKEYRSIILSKEGYYRYEIFLSRELDTENIRRVVLSRMIEAPTGTYIDPETFASGSSTAVNTIRKLIAMREKNLEDLSRKRSEERTILEKTYGDFRDQEVFEDSDIYRERYSLFNEIKKEALESSENRIKQQEHTIREKILLLHEYLRQIEERVYQTFFPSSIISIGDYVSDGEYFPISIFGNEQGHRFTIEGVLPIPPSKAISFSYGKDESLVKVSYKARSIPSGSGDLWSLGYEYSGFSILFRGAEYPLTTKPLEFSSPRQEVSSTLSGGIK